MANMTGVKTALHNTNLPEHVSLHLPFLANLKTSGSSNLLTGKPCKAKSSRPRTSRGIAVPLKTNISIGCLVCRLMLHWMMQRPSSFLSTMPPRPKIEFTFRKTMLSSGYTRILKHSAACWRLDTTLNQGDPASNGQVETGKVPHAMPHFPLLSWHSQHCIPYPPTSSSWL